MKKMLAIAAHEVRLVFSIKGNLLSMVVLPIVFSFVIGLATSGGAPSPNGDPQMILGTVNYDTGQQSYKLLGYLEDSDAIRPVLLDEDVAVANLAGNEAAGVLIIPTDFSQKLEAGTPQTVVVQVVAMDNVGIIAREAVQTALAQVERPILAARASSEVANSSYPFASDNERATYLEQGLELAAQEAATEPIAVQLEQASTAPKLNYTGGYTYSSPGQLVTWVLSTLLATGAGLVYERTNGTLRRLMVMPTAKAVTMMGKVLGYVLQGLLQMTMLIAFGMLVLKVNWGRSPWALIMVSVSFALAATALGTLIANISKTTKQAGGLVTLGTFLLAPLGGCWFPLEITPKAFQAFAQVLPTTWAMRGFMDVIARGQGPQGVLLETLVLLGFAALFFVIGLWRFRFE